ncbi:MAG TPA: chromosomal replication initiator protein DnaA [Caulobacteraceae bacterium]
MTKIEIASDLKPSPAASVWVLACTTLRRELGEATFGSWVEQAKLLEDPNGGVVLVTPTGIAADWIRRNAWRRIVELWAVHDPSGRHMNLKSRNEMEASGRAAALRLVAVDGHSPGETTAPVELPDAEPARIRAPRPAGLQDRYTFDTFVQGPTNEFAYAVARRVASWADGHFNPVLFHAPYGFGKTHLLQALALEASRARPDKRVIYLTAERFLSNFVKALQERSTADFKEELRTADLLLIDDAHFVAGKTTTQEELFQTLTALVGDGRRVVLSADRPPSALTEMDGRLRSHLAAGLVCGIEPADRTLRLAILQKKLDVLCRQQGMRCSQVNERVLAFLADRFIDSVRELEGALNTLVARAGERLPVVDVDEAQAILRPHLRTGERRITVDDIQKAVSEYYGMKQADLLSDRRNRAIARPRQTAMWLCKQLTTRSLPDIGRRFGGRDHTTVLHAVRKIEQLKGVDAPIAADLETLLRKLRG